MTPFPITEQSRVLVKWSIGFERYASEVNNRTNIICYVISLNQIMHNVSCDFVCKISFRYLCLRDLNNVFARSVNRALSTEEIFLSDYGLSAIGTFCFVNIGR